MSNTKLAADTINVFRSGQDLVSSEPAELKKTIAELEARIREQNSLLDQKNDYIDVIRQASKPVQEPAQVRQQPDYAELEKVKAQLRTVQRERDELKEKYRDTLRKLHSNSVVDPNEFLRLKDELKRLKESQQTRIRGEREAERDRLKAETKDQQEGWQKMFTCLEKLAMKSVATLSEHEATSPEIRELARVLRTKPDELRSGLMMKELTYRDAFEELAPLLYAATAKISETRKRGLPITKVEHRARMLLEILDRVETISTSDAIKIIAGDEGRIHHRKDALRAMRKAAALEPHKAIFSKGSDGMPSELKRKGGSIY